MTAKIPKSVIIIPARLASTRLPNKLLLAETGQPLIQYTWEAACRSLLAERVIVACDDERIFETVRRFGGEARMTDPAAQCGTDRIAEVAAEMPEAEIVVNVQGDEPRLAPESIDRVIRLLADDPEAVMSTLCTPIREKRSLEDPACVKAVFDQNGRAIYFSRSVIPYPRSWSDDMLWAKPPLFYQHLGIYGYRRDFLLQFKSMPHSDLEMAESLEQLRVLSAGYVIKIGTVQEKSFGIDTPEDYARFVAMIKAEQ